MFRSYSCRFTQTLCVAVPLLATSACGDGSAVKSTSTNSSTATLGSVGSSSSSSVNTGPVNTVPATTSSESVTTVTTSAQTSSSASASTSSSTSETGATTTAVEPQSLLKTAVADPELSTFVELVKAAGLEALLSGADVYTVFAPTNAYFNALPLVTLDALKANKLKLRDQLLGHLVKGSIKANELAIGFVKKESEATSPKTTLIIQKTSEGLKIGDASVVERDLVATNGVIHKIETLLKAPDKDVSGVIDTQSNLSYLSHTLHAEDLFTKFQGEGPFTFFAPTNAAIVALGDDTPTGQALTNGLNFHVANMIKYSFEFTHGEVIATLLANKNQTMSVEGDQVKFGEALIVKGNIQATNGVVHVIDRVQMPKP